MPPSNRPHLTDGRVDARGRWVPKKPATPARGTTHKRRRKPTDADKRAAIYATWPRAIHGPGPWTLFVPGVKTGSEGNFRGGHQVTKARKDRQQRAIFAALVASKLALRPMLPVNVCVVRVTTRKSTMDKHAEWHKHVIDEVARWLGCDDGDESSVRWSPKHDVGPVAGVRIEVTARDAAATEAALAQVSALMKAVGL
jgi:hypothetical protein